LTKIYCFIFFNYNLTKSIIFVLVKIAQDFIFTSNKIFKKLVHIKIVQLYIEQLSRVKESNF